MYFSLSYDDATFTSLALNAAKSTIPFVSVKRQPRAWWSLEVEDAVKERRNGFAVAHRSDEDCQAYILAFLHASFFINKAKAEAWQAACSSFSSKSNSKPVCFLLRFVAGSSFSYSFSPNFPKYSSSRESVLVYDDYLK